MNGAADKVAIVSGSGLCFRFLDSPNPAILSGAVSDRRVSRTRARCGGDFKQSVQAPVARSLLGWQNVEDRLSAMVESIRDAVSVARDDSEIAHRLACLAEHWFERGAKLSALEQLSGGASQETWSFDVDARGSLRPLILRRNPVGVVKHDMVAGMETEARLIRLAEQAGAPAAPGVPVLSPDARVGFGFRIGRVGRE